MKIEVSNGEIVDKFTILQIKSEIIKDVSKLENINTELHLLHNICTLLEINIRHYLELCDVNKKLWDVEDELRLCEKEQRFDDHFITLARSVYQLNDKRAAIKKKINIDTNSQLIEEKSYGK
jgi:hypothetical protein